VFSAMLRMWRTGLNNYLIFGLAGLLTIASRCFPALPQSGPAAKTITGSNAPIIDVRRFGARGDGQHDDTTSIQAAIDSVSAVGETLYFPPGKYTYRKLLISNKTKLTITGQRASLIEISDGGGAALIASPGASIRGLTFDHASHNGYILDITSPDVTIEGNTFENLGDGVHGDVKAAIYIAPGSHRALVRGNSFLHLRGGPAGAVRGVYINNFRSRSEASYNARILNNRFDTITSPVDADGIVIDQQGFPSKATIEGNTFYNCSKRAVKLMSNENVVRNNTMTVEKLGAQSYSAVSSYGDGNRIAGNHAKAVGCNKGCSFYGAWELSGNDNVLSDNTAENPGDTVDKDIDCVTIVRPETYQALNNIVLSGNTCRKFRYIRIRPDTPVRNLVIEGNWLIDPIAQPAIAVFPRSPISGLSFLHNTAGSGAVLLGFYEPGAAGKTKFDIGANQGLIDLNLGDDPAPVSLKVQSALVSAHGVEIVGIASGQKRARGSGPPNGGYWRIGDLVYDSNASAKGLSGWKCISAGVSGKWVRFGPS
jgi:hypothetical protein